MEDPSVEDVYNNKVAKWWKWQDNCQFCDTCKESYALEAQSEFNCQCELCGLWFLDEEDRDRHALVITEKLCQRDKNWHDDCPILSPASPPASPPPDFYLSPSPKRVITSVPESPLGEDTFFNLVLWTKICFLCENCCETWCERQVSWQNEKCKSCHKWYWDSDHLREHMFRVNSGQDPAGDPEDTCDVSTDHSCAKC